MRARARIHVHMYHIGKSIGIRRESVARSPMRTIIIIDPIGTTRSMYPVCLRRYERTNCGTPYQLADKPSRLLPPPISIIPEIPESFRPARDNRVFRRYAGERKLHTLHPPQQQQQRVRSELRIVLNCCAAYPPQLLPTD